MIAAAHGWEPFASCQMMYNPPTSKRTLRVLRPAGHRADHV